jgi:hypothetical protein
MVDEVQSTSVTSQLYILRIQPYWCKRQDWAAQNKVGLFLSCGGICIITETLLSANQNALKVLLRITK